MAIITLTTDFGTRDGYVGAMKGVVLSIAPHAHLHDLAHQLPAHDVTHAAFVLAEAARYFPANTIHVAVVDPGVGSARLPICVCCKEQWYVGPDNGLFTLCLGDDPWIGYQLTNPAYFRHAVSPTFHGRDLFAPIAAHVANGVDPQQFGPPLATLTQLPLPTTQRTGDELCGEVIYLDHFGNAVTNIRTTDLSVTGNMLRIQVGEVVIDGLARTYEDRPPLAPLAVIGSHHLLEIAVREGSAARQLQLRRGTPVQVRCTTA
ncbi:MAG: SAM-dependent chlorinase/fluorinase [Deltaproteobacteria bacterium]|nr:SAM-dependent chlorinase/fluorinase [Deltaproteobacteria bacterium]